MKRILFFILPAIGVFAAYFFFSPFYPSSHSSRWMPLHQHEREEGEEAEQEELLERLAQEKLMTQDPALGFVPTERLVAAQQLAAKLKRTARETGAASLAWKERGPNNLGGRTRAILIDKNDATGNTVMAGSVGGGLWRTTNFKSASPVWTALSSVSANLAISALAQDPSNANILYAGTGEGYYNTDAIRGLGIYKSTDGGLNWSLLSSTTTGGANYYDFTAVQKILVYPNGHVYASGISDRYCNSGGILKSTNGGASWTRVIGSYNGSGSCSGAVDFFGYDMALSKNGDLYASVVDKSTGMPKGKIYRSPASTTVGNVGTWLNVTPPAATGAYWQRISLACSPNNNNKVYALLQGTGDGIGGMRVSNEAGNSWTDITNTVDWCDGGGNGGTDFSRSQAWYNLTIAVKPDDDQTVFVGGVDILKSSNSGASWSQLTQWAGGCGSLPVVHADIHAICPFPGSANEFIVANDGGIYYTADGGVTFSNKSAGYNTIQYYSAALHPASGANYILAGAQDNGTHQFTASGLGAVTTPTGGDGGFCFIDQKDPAVQMTSLPYLNYYISRNGGGSFPIGAFVDGGRFINPADYDSDQKILYCGYNAGFIARIKNIASGTIGADAFSFSLEGSRMVSAVKVDPNIANRVWFAFSTAEGAANQVPKLYYIDSANAASPNSPVAVTVPSLAAGSYISSMDMESGNSAHMILTVSNYGVASIWETMDGGATWTSLDANGTNLPDMPVRWAVFLPAGTNFTGRVAAGGIMIGTELGIWTATATSGTATIWTQSSGFPNVRVDMLKWRPSDNTVAAATHGRGLFTTTLNSTLPVSLLNFKGQLESNGIALSWSSGSEYNSKNFIVNKSIDGTNYQAIGTVPAAGTSLTSRGYRFNDDRVTEYNYYRLSMVDMDGHTEWSKVILIKNPDMPQAVKVLQNPVHMAIAVQLQKRPQQAVFIQLLNTNGHAVLQRKMSVTAYQFQFDLPNASVPPGMYILKTVIDGKVFVNKVIKQ